MLVALNSQYSNTSLTFVDVRKQLNIQEEFSSEQTHSKTENANLSCGEPKTPTALKVSVGVFGPLINPYWLKEATRAIKILQSLAYTNFSYYHFAKRLTTGNNLQRSQLLISLISRVRGLLRTRGGGRVVRWSWISFQCRDVLHFGFSRARACCACSRCGWGLFGHFYSPLSFLFSFSLSLGDGPI